MTKLNNLPDKYHNQKKTSLDKPLKDVFDCLNLDQIQSFLLSGTKVTPLIWAANQKNGVKLMIKKNIFHGYSNQDGRIELGMQEVPQHIKEQFGLDKDVPDDFAKKYIFSHENNHHVLFYMFKNQDKFANFSKIYNNLKKIRETTGKGLSQLGNMSIYNSNQRQTAHEEDFVELLNRYCMSPQNFKQYLNFLANGDKVVLAQKNLYKIPQTLADWLYTNIAECIAIFLKENGIINKIKTNQS